jgi:hypothetical protein
MTGAPGMGSLPIALPPLLNDGSHWYGMNPAISTFLVLSAQRGAKVASASQARRGRMFVNKTLRTGGKCLDLTGLNTTNGTAIEIWTCNGGQNQRWTMFPDGTIRTAMNSNKYLDLSNGNTADLTKLDIWDCNGPMGSSNQRWQLNNDNTVTGVGSKCMDLTEAVTTDGTKVEYYHCTGGWNQQWGPQ